MRRIVGALLCVGMLCLVALGSANLWSCYSPPTPLCGFQCNVSNGYACPADYTCAKVDQTCRLNSAPTGTSCQSDARPDTPGLDANLTPTIVTSTTPSNGATEVDRAAGITITFSGHVSSVRMSSFLVMDGTSQLAGAYVENAANDRWSFAGTLPGGHLITVNLTSQITNDLGVPLTAYSFSFTTHDDEPPMLVSSAPLDLGTATSVNQPIVVVFSEPVAAVDSTTMVVRSGATQIAGTFTHSTDLTTWTFTATAGLPAASTIKVALGTGIVDGAGNHLVATAFSFTTP